MGNDLPIKIVCFVTVIVIPAIMGGVCLLFRKRLAKPHYPADGELLMRYVLPVRLLGGVFMAFIAPAMVCAIGILAPPEGWVEGISAGASLAMFLSIGISLFVETHYRWILISPEGITCHSPWRREYSYGWADIVEIICPRYQHGAFIFRGWDGREFKVSPVLTGMREFVPYLMRYLDPKVGAQAHRVIMQMGMLGLLTYSEATPPNDLPDIGGRTVSDSTSIYRNNSSPEIQP